MTVNRRHDLACQLRRVIYCLRWRVRSIPLLFHNLLFHVSSNHLRNIWLYKSKQHKIAQRQQRPLGSGQAGVIDEQLGTETRVSEATHDSRRCLNLPPIRSQALLKEMGVFSPTVRWEFVLLFLGDFFFGCVVLRAVSSERKSTRHNRTFLFLLQEIGRIYLKV